MAQKVRIARVDASAFQPIGQSGSQLWDQHSAITSFIRRYLPASSASILAEPVRTQGSSFIDWCSDISGLPVPYASLAGEEKAKVGRLLADRLQALRDLAARHSGEPAAALLNAAAVTPPDDAVHVINGQPVIIGWGRQGAAPAVAPTVAPRPIPAAIPAAATAAGATVAARRGFPWLLAAGLAALALVLLWWLWPLSWLGLGTGGDRLAALNAEEAALSADIAAAEAELRRRLAACVTPQTPPPTKDVPPPEDKLPPAKAIEDVPPQQPPAKPDPEQPAKPVAEPPARKAPPPEPPKPVPHKPEPPKQQVKEDTPPPAPQKTACPPPRKKWEAPELVVLLDASGSMRLKTGVSEQEITALTRRARAGDRAAAAQLSSMISAGGDSRLNAAKSAIGRMLNSLPGDMDVGLVVFGNCQGADNHKFFSPAERPRLNALLDGITPMQGTPLARGIERAGNVVDGRTVPATLVVVTDGEDSCGGDPCAAARALKAAKPMVTINVVDVNGMGEGRCIAEATGGKVLPVKSAADLPEMIRRASGEAPLPPGCGG